MPLYKSMAKLQFLHTQGALGSVLVALPQKGYTGKDVEESNQNY